MERNIYPCHQAPVPPLKGSQALKESSGRRAGSISVSGASALPSAPAGAPGIAPAGAHAGAPVGMVVGGRGSASVERIKKSHSTLAQNNEEILLLRSHRENTKDTKGI